MVDVPDGIGHRKAFDPGSNGTLRQIAAPPVSGSLRGAKMLVTLVDDDEAVRESLPDLVIVFGYAVSVFPSAEALLASGSLDQTDCLILDLNMPGMGGLGLFREIKRSGRSVPVIFITAHQDEALRDRLLKQGAIDCLYKPFSDTALLAALKTALGES